MNIWLLSDFHYRHNRMASLRGFENVDIMDDTLIYNFNKNVKEDDLTYFTGDFAWKSPVYFMDRLNGKFIYIKGNHDQLFKHNKIIKWVDGYLDTKINGKYVTFCHFPMLMFEKSHYNAYHVYGHSHSRMAIEKLSGKRINVAVEALQPDPTKMGTPISWEELEIYMNNQPDNWDLVNKGE